VLIWLKIAKFTTQRDILTASSSYPELRFDDRESTQKVI
jgi:hypothetical protein